MGLRQSDLEFTVDPVFEIDSYKSKMGDDEDIVVLSFSVNGEQPAKETALQKAKDRFAAKKAAAADKVSELKDKAKQFGGRKFGKVKTKFTKQSGEQA